MKVNIVCYEDPKLWILGKLATNLHNHLLQAGIVAKISQSADPDYDINHHIIYLDYKPELINSKTINTLMITHIDNSSKFSLLKKNLESTSLGICMSSDTMNNLTILGIAREKLCYINPAHDGEIKVKKINIGITCRVQIDGRKREYILNYLADNLSPMYFNFIIMGKNWNKQVDYLRRRDFVVEYDEQFNNDRYNEIISSLDYYLYMGFDEGQMGFVDALNAGVKTIVTPQGYHIDTNNQNLIFFNTQDDLLKILKGIEKEKWCLINSVKDWTWHNYTMKHLQIWQYLINNEVNNISFTSGIYKDGIASLNIFSESKIINKNTSMMKFKLKIQRIKQFYFIKKSRIKKT